MDKKLRTFIIIATGIMIFSAFYYFVIFLPSEQREIRKQRAQIEEVKRSGQKGALSACLKKTYNDYSKKWSRRCRRLGKHPDCALPSYYAHILSSNYEDNRNDCFRSYPEGLIAREK